VPKEIKERCSSGDLPPGYSPKAPWCKINLQPHKKPVERYVLSGELLGGGATGIVQKGFDPATGREVAVKRLMRDSACPLRFVEIRVVGGEEANVPALHLEGYAAAGTRALPYSGPLASDVKNIFAQDPFPPLSVKGCVLLVKRGGGVPFSVKVSNARCGGAVGVILINTHDYTEEYSLGRVDDPLPSMIVGHSDGEAALQFLAANENADAVAAVGDAARRCMVEVRTDAEHEVAVCRKLAPHRQVLEILDTWIEGDTPVVVCELCTGGPILRPRCDVNTSLLVVEADAGWHCSSP